MSDLPVNILMNVKGNLKEAFGELDAALKKTTGQLDSASKAATNTGEALKKQSQTSIMDTANALNNVAYAGFNLYNAFDNIMDMQVSVMRSQLTLKASLNSVEDAQRRYNVALASGDTEKAAIALADLNIATERASVATERAEMIQGNYNETIVRSALTIIPTLTMGFKSLKEVIGGLGGSLSSAGSALSSFATGPIGLAIIGIAAIGTAIYLLIDNFNAMNEATRKFDAAIKSGKDALSTFNDMMSKSSTSASGWKIIIDLDNQAIKQLTNSLVLQEAEIEKYTTGMNGAVLGYSAAILVGKGLIGVNREQVEELKRLNRETEANIEVSKAKLTQDTRNLQIEQTYFDTVTIKSEAYQASLTEAAGRFSELLSSDIAHSNSYYVELDSIVAKFAALWKRSPEEVYKLLSSYTPKVVEQLKIQVEAIEPVNEAFTNLTASLENQSNVANVKLSPALKNIAERFNEAMSEKRFFTASMLLTAFGAKWGLTADQVKNAIDELSAAEKQLTLDTEAALAEELAVTEKWNIDRANQLAAALAVTENWKTGMSNQLNMLKASTANELSEMHDAFGYAFDAGDFNLALAVVQNFADMYGISLEQATTLLENFVSKQEIDLQTSLRIVEEWKSGMSSKFNMLRASTANELSEMHDDFQWAFEAGDFDFALKIVQNFADMYGISLDQATTLLENFVAKQAEIPKTLKEQLVDKAQGEFEKFQKCMSGKALTLETDVTDNMSNLADNITSLIKNGLVGEAQNQMQAYVDCNTNKMATMAKDLASTISDMVDAHNKKLPELTKAAEAAVGAERIAILAEIAEIEANYHLKLPQLQTWLDMIWGQITTDTIANVDDTTTGVSKSFDDLLTALAPFPANIQQILWDTATNRGSLDGLAVQLTNAGYNFYGLYDEVVAAFTLIQTAMANGVITANDTLATLGDTVPTAVDDVVSEVEEMWNEIRARTNAELADLGIATGTVGVSGPSTYINPIVPVHGSRNLRPENQMASGGIVTRPTLALLGERGPEAVVPLSSGGGIGDVHIHIDSPLINVQGGIDKATADYTITQVERMLKSVIVEASSSGAPLTSKRIRKGNILT